MDNNKIKSMLTKLKENSIGKNKKSKFQLRKRMITKRVLSALLLSMMVVCSFGCTPKNNYNNNSNNTIITFESSSDELDYSLYEISIYEQARTSDLLYENNLIDSNINSDNKRVYNYTKEDYQKISGLDETYLYGFYLIADSNSVDEMCKALGYNNLDDFLIKNNYVDSNKEPSIDEWYNSNIQDINKIMNEEKGKTK